MPAKWERFYLGVINALLGVAALLLFWNIITTSDWRVRSAYVFLIGWGIALRLAGRWIPAGLTAAVQHWRTRGRLYELGFNLLWIGLPLGTFGYLARWPSRWELLIY